MLKYNFVTLDWALGPRPMCYHFINKVIIIANIIFCLQVIWNVFSIGFIYLAVIWIGLYTKYLTERAQRKAFLETRYISIYIETSW